jgi:cytochrome bd-type quinol oxidase subunit 2
MMARAIADDLPPVEISVYSVVLGVVLGHVLSGFFFRVEFFMVGTFEDITQFLTVLVGAQSPVIIIPF